MKRGQRPGNHVRVVSTRKGRRAVSVNPGVPRALKRMKNAQYRKIWPKLMPRADYDGDGVANYRDCRPFNKKMQDDPKDPAGRFKPISQKEKELEMQLAFEKRRLEAEEEKRNRQRQLEEEKERRRAEDEEARYQKRQAEIEAKEAKRREEERREEDRRKYGALQAAIAADRRKRFGF